MRDPAALVRKRVSVEGLAVYLSPGDPLLGPEILAAPPDAARWDELMLPMVRAPPPPSLILAPLSAALSLEADLRGLGTAAAVSALEPPRCVAQLEARARGPRQIMEGAGACAVASAKAVSGVLHCPGPSTVAQVLSETLAIALRHTQFLAILRLADTVSRHETRHALRRCRRPALRPRRGGAAAAWWGYAARAVGARRREAGVHLCWAELRKRRDARRGYLALYQAWLAAPGSAVLGQKGGRREAVANLAALSVAPSPAPRRLSRALGCTQARSSRSCSRRSRS